MLLVSDGVAAFTLHADMTAAHSSTSPIRLPVLKFFIGHHSLLVAD
ncbi:hypothetical protein [Paenibacillus sp. FSL H8-0332]